MAPSHLSTPSPSLNIKHNSNLFSFQSYNHLATFYSQLFFSLLENSRSSKPVPPFFIFFALLLSTPLSHQTPLASTPFQNSTLLISDFSSTPNYTHSISNHTHSTFSFSLTPSLSLTTTPPTNSSLPSLPTRRTSFYPAPHNPRTKLKHTPHKNNSPHSAYPCFLPLFCLSIITILITPRPKTTLLSCFLFISFYLITPLFALSPSHSNPSH